MDAAGNSLAFNDNDGPGWRGSEITFTPSSTGAYYLVVSSGFDTGTYTLFTADLTPDDFRNTSVDVSVAVGGERSGYSGGENRVHVTLVAGQTYRVEVRGADNGPETLANPFLQILAPSGAEVAFDDDSGPGRDPRITFTASVSGTYVLAISPSTPGGEGTYRLSVEQVQAADDFAASISTGGAVTAGGARSGAIGAGDSDWFGVALVAGQTYGFDLQGADSGQGSLADPFLVLRDSQGNPLASDNDGGAGLDARITYNAPRSGTYYLSASSSAAGGTGTYRLAVENLPPADDFAASVATTGAIAQKGRQGAIETPGDEDWIKVTLFRNVTYVLSAQGADSEAGTLANPFLQLRDASGNLIASDDDGGVGRNGQITFTPQSTTDFYLTVRSADPGGVGTYSARADLLIQDDYGRSVFTAATMAVDTTRTGGIDFWQDRDLFRIELMAGQTYEFRMQGSASGQGTLVRPNLQVWNADQTVIQRYFGPLDQDPVITFTPTITGVYYVAATSGEESGTGSYRLSAERLAPFAVADSYTGGSGDDTFQVNYIGDLVFEGVNGGTDTVVSTDNYYLWANIENLILAEDAGPVFGVGNGLDNVITGSSGNNLLIGGEGNDTLHGRDGDDSLFGQDGDDRLNGGSNQDALFGEAGADVINGDGGLDYALGGEGDDVIDGGGDPDALHGEAGADSLDGGPGFFTDILVGGEGNDTIDGDSGLGDYDLMDGGAGDDAYRVDTPADLTFEAVGGGTDTVFADISGAGYYLYANVENLTLLGQTPYGVGNELDNVLTGNAIGNHLLGGAGNDTINGMGGNDVLFGQAGADTFVFGRGAGGDVIGDFQVGVDRIDLRAFGLTFAALQSRMVQDGAVMGIVLGDGDLVVLHNVTIAQLTAGDFIL